MHFSGRGKYVREQGKYVYEGEWKYGKPHGKGIEIWYILFISDLMRHISQLA